MARASGLYCYPEVRAVVKSGPDKTCRMMSARKKRAAATHLSISRTFARINWIKSDKIG